MQFKYLLMLLPGLWFVTPQADDHPLLPKDVAAEYKKLPKELDYNVHVKPILSDKCFACHGNDKDKRKAGLRLDVASAAYGPIPDSPDIVAIVPKDLENSEAFQRLISDDPDYMMPTPKSHLTLSAKEKAILAKWIEDGAIYKPHWAFVKPQKRNVPAVTNSSWGINEIDKFILQKLEIEGLNPSKKASKEILLRRLSLDLTGLPPTIAEIKEFLKDKSANAYEKQVDRLLNTPHYGEKMATYWLDIARFADTHGYQNDRERDMSPYRDWVINAFNKNMPYDTFVHQQLAGDLMPNPTRDMLIATAFNRNYPHNEEGGIVEEEFQTEYAVDRTNTFGDAFLGISLQCAKCHDHKYDPISQKNYFELYSFFNNLKEAGQITITNDLPTPTLLLPTKEKEEVLAFINNNIKNQEEKITQTSKNAIGGFEKWLTSKAFQSLAQEKLPQAGLEGFFDFEDSLRNALNKKQTGAMKHENGSGGDLPMLVKKGQNTILTLDGDTYLDLKPIGSFRRSVPFSIGIWVNIPNGLKEGVIFHKSNGERTFNFKGYHMYLKNNKLEIMMAHTAPSNALTKTSINDVPRDRWIHLMMTYDGSSKAAGFNLFLDGQQLDMETTMDQLYKDIQYNAKSDQGLQIGAWWRGWGFKGGLVDDVTVYNRQLTDYEIKIVAKQKTWNEIATKQPESLENSDKDILKKYYFSAVDTNMIAATNELTKLRTSLADSMENIKELMVMQEYHKPQPTHILIRGSYDSLGERVWPNTPESLLKYSEKFPKNRLGLAQWLTHDDNPLTARIAVNRIWQNFFGTGLVKTSEDFGNQGEMPSHPELLDWLAIKFRESGWDIKAMNKLIVMSATYQQESKATPQLSEIDPENRLLARGPSFRMTAEMIRDNALTASGLLNRSIGGRSFKAYQPEGLWSLTGARFVQDSSQGIYRRSLYIYIKRSIPNPTLMTFDASARNACTARRQKTNTPLQAFVTLNDPTFLEASKVLGQQMASQKNSKSAIIEAYQKLTSQKPTSEMVKLLVDLYEKQLAIYIKNPSKTKGILKAGLYKLDSNVDANKTAAFAVVASVILNSDAGLVRR